MLLYILHETRYRYQGPSGYGVQQLRLTARTGPGQKVLNWLVSVDGGTVEFSYRDHHDNEVSLVSLPGDQHEMTIRCAGQVETKDLAGMLGRHDGTAPLWYFTRETSWTTPCAGIAQLIAPLQAAPPDSIPTLHALSAAVADAVRYDLTATPLRRTASEVLAAGSGVCQDHAHVFVCAARALGYPARYVSGYLLLDDPVASSAGHAWAEVHVGGLGWVGFDISNQVCPNDRYVRVACGLDGADAAPITGIIRPADPAGELMHVHLQVQQ